MVEDKKQEKKTVEKEEVKEVASKKKDEYLYAVGRRKTSVAQVRVFKKGTGKFLVNEKEVNKYFGTAELVEKANAPLILVGQTDKLDVTVKVLGGGPTGQAEAIRQGISRALLLLNPNFRKPLKKAGFLTRDARKKERKKPGLKKARKAPQWKKR